CGELTCVLCCSRALSCVEGARGGVRSSLCVCVCVCVCECVCVSEYMCVCVCVYRGPCTGVCVCVCIAVHVSSSSVVHLCVWENTALKVGQRTAKTVCMYCTGVRHCVELPWKQA